MWTKVIAAEEIPRGNSACVKHNGWQIAVFHLENGSWHAVQNICPHHEEKVLFVGNVESVDGNPVLECPLHSRKFNLKDGTFMGEREGFDLQVYPAYSDGDWVYLDLMGAEVEN